MAFAGAETWSCVALPELALIGLPLPKRTCVPEVKFVPLSVTAAPPIAVPSAGCAEGTPAKIGAGNGSDIGFETSRNATPRLFKPTRFQEFPNSSMLVDTPWIGISGTCPTLCMVVVERTDTTLLFPYVRLRIGTAHLAKKPAP